MGVEIDDSCLFTHQFVGDQVIVASDGENVQYMIRKRMEEYREWGRTVNINKTKDLCIGTQDGHLEVDNGQEILQCQQYEHLGRNKRGRPRLEYQNTIQKSMSGRNISPEDCDVRRGWRLGLGQRRKTGEESGFRKIVDDRSSGSRRSGTSIGPSCSRALQGHSKHNN
ncbi:hypothetical protein HUJ04_003244 [Dendroctonus ponderosae]|nr:hypothetical protein HUJ04_003244 [Dendroctonus ponderosae]